MSTHEPIVVIGSACRFPGGLNNPSKLWEFLKKPRDLQSEVPKERFDIDGFYHPDGSHHGRTNARHGYFLEENLRAFDAQFFNIQAGEAESMDPQQRLLLEATYDALSSAGLKVQDLRGSNTAVYVGTMTHDFELTKVQDIHHTPTYFATGAATSIASNRLSYFYDWHGPSMTIDTACSSSLVAVHHAVQQLRSGTSKIAVAAGANIMLSPLNYITESKLSMLSPTGRSRMWDAAADGYARGEGIASIVLKTLSQALRDGDNIECVIRETGVNQDGRTTGITMPSHSAQQALIRETYAKAGLDLAKLGDRPQFFEAHGTGTPAGDPQEAEAIATAFFGEGAAGIAETPNLFVGSLKTVIGHTEGTAGIAGLLKASLAVQHGIVPPNMLFENLSPRVEPFYQRLRITTEALPWPAVQAGQPRRASVNSFGFGGTNAHAIIEEYQGNRKQTPSGASVATSTQALPLVFSAKSQRSLKSNMESMLQFIKSNADVDMVDLAWTLLSKQSVLPTRHTVPGHTKEAICLALENAIKGGMGNDYSSVNINRDKPNALGIFTGQGAQWPGMLKTLITSIPFAKDIIAELDHSLQTLPTEYRPSWTLLEQFMLEGDASNVRHASYSQPLCAAVQIVLVRLLAAAGVEFTTIVGHSSGEIACAFAAGFISAAQAIRVAYIRGLVSKHAASPSGQEGCMLAAGMSWDDAQELCELEAFEGRVCIAACNSPDSITLSGDTDALQEVQAILEDESKFARLLKVDKAYHSHHMLPCSDPYIKALTDSGCAVADGSDSSSVAWYSSVYENKRIRLSDITAEYWKDNLVSPVLFSQAVEQAAIEHRPLDVAIEVGAHPALKAPATATIKNVTSEELPYVGCLERGTSDVNSFSSALGCLWERFATLNIIDADKYVSTISPQKSAKNLSKILPGYSWDHSRTYWTESRAVSAHLRGPHPHLLLGTLLPSSTTSTFQWQNFVRPRDHEWLQGHELQGQAVYPAAGYVIMAMEAARHVAGDRQVQLLELLDLSIDKAISFDDENSMAELMLTVKIVSDADQLTLSFNIDSCLSRENKLSTSAKGQLIVTFGTPEPHVLPPAQEEHPHTNNIDISLFYRELDSLGYDYSKNFRCVYSMRRADSRATGNMAHPRLDDGPRQIVLHPANLDLAFQTIMGAYSSPGDKRMRSLYVPVHVDRIALVPSVCASTLSSLDGVHYTATNTYDKGDSLAGDVEVFDGNDRTVLYQVENIVLKPLSPPSASEDHRPFTKTTWGPLSADKVLDIPELWATEQDKQVIPIIERVVYYYIKQFLSQLTDEDRKNAAAGHQRYIYWNEHVLAKAQAGKHLFYDKSWDNDTQEYIDKLCEENWYHPHLRLAKRVSENSLSTIRENSNPFIWMNQDGLLTEFYTSYLTSGPSWKYGQELVGQIAHRFQNMDILEIGGGTGSATGYILSIPQLGFNSYTFTDISAAFFEKAREVFSEHQDRMEFKKLDVTKSPEEQGFKPHSYDLVVASSVLHATPKLTETMSNVRSLLKPGGHVVICEATHKEHLRVGYLFGLFPDWWAGINEGRDLDPFATYEEWDNIFRQTGFAGIDSRTQDRESYLFPNSLFSTHAITPKFSRLDDPLSAPPKDAYPQLVVIGGDSPCSAAILNGIRKALPHRRILDFKRFRDLKSHESKFESKSTFVVLSELDEELFDGFDEVKLDAVKCLFFTGYASNVLWLTEDAWIKNPRQAMGIGMLRSVRLENPDIHVQALDVDDIQKMDIKFFLEQLLRLEEYSTIQEDVLWTLEPEIYLTKGRASVPRIKHDIERNNRMNSGRRPILANVSPSKTPVNLRFAESGLYLEAAENFPPLGSARKSSFQSVQVDYALAKAIRVGHFGHLYLLKGIIAGTNKAVVALSETNSSLVEVPDKWVFALPNSGSSVDSVLLPVAASLLASSALSNIAPGSNVLLFEPPKFIVNAFTAFASGRRLRLHLATTSSTSDSGAGPWIRLHPRETDRGLKQALPFKISALFNFSDQRDAVILGDRLAGSLPSSSLKFHVTDFVQDHAAPLSLDEEAEAAQTKVIEQMITDSNALNSSSLDDATVRKITSLEGPLDISTVLDWRADEQIPARVRAIDSGDLFTRDKTYLLVGLAQSIGRSLARWIVTHGGRHVVLSSRNPQTPDPKWVKEIEELGGSITVLAMDVSKEESVDAGLAKLRQTSPPIGGIAYGPLVLHDALLRNMDLATMEVVLNSKVVGARLLHERFSDHKATPLDFFVMFSSAATTGGNPGQSNYTAANSYLQALAQYRRTKGLTASTIHIGAVMGVGYLARTQREKEFQEVSDMDTLGEDEFRTLFAEAVVSGRRVAGLGDCKAESVTDMSDIEIGTGIPELQSRHKETIKFYDDPRFGNLKTPEQRGNASGSSGSKTSVKEQLLQATTMDEVRQAIVDGLSEKMRGVLHIPAEESVNATAPLLDQGVDSLGAITVASWFSKQLFIDIPILRVLSGASIAELAEEAAGRLPPSAIPLVASAGVTEEPNSSSEPSESLGSTSATTAPSPSPEDEGSKDGTAVARQAPFALSQEYSWKLQQQLADDPTIFHNTIGMVMEGNMDLEKLARAVTTSLYRHDIFRTAFRPASGSNAKPMQVVLQAPTWRMQTVKVADRNAAVEALKKLENETYDTAGGEAFKIVVYTWSPNHHMFVVAYHRLGGDGSTTENFFAEVSQIYNGAQLPPPPQFTDFATRQRADLDSGRLDADISYWTSLYEKMPAVLPILPLPQAQKHRGNSVAWEQHTGMFRLSPVLAFRIKERTKKLKVTPMHFYLAAYHVLLARLTGQDDVAIGIADTNRSSIQEISTMGFFANLLPVRLACPPSTTFNEELESTKERMRQAMQHARVPYGVTLERLGLAGIPARQLQHAPLFQAVFDYRQGGAESGTIGGASITEVIASRERTPYDVVLEMSDDPTREPLLTVKLQSSLYGPQDTRAFLDAYVSLLTTYSANTALRVDEAKLAL
ncbi:Lovastatin nonaketide synthase 1 [Colletotrichum chlorophyti]|uniref:Lovastatin nonaketide synthase 1 n=1 Tax=Colletotrichum chlorophyti TaxID=708187 RepID=A0A1Q8S7R0_9PEZI|nr:Lovastatin nonaketide synthase 1 [Colletotrichum chlorophyti]